MIIKCENEEKLNTVREKLQEKTNIEWSHGGKPTEVLIDPYKYPVYLIIRDNKLTWSEDFTSSMKHMLVISADEFLEHGFFQKAIPEVQSDPVNHPSHYTQGKVECIDAMEQVFGVEAVKHFCLLNWFKYNFRHELKNGQEDLEKAGWYFRKYQELLNR